MSDIEREEMIEQAHKLYDNSRNLISELRWQRTYFCRGSNIISKQEKLFNIWIFDECLKRLEKLEKIEQIITKYQDTLDNFYNGKPRDLLESDVLRDIKEVLDKDMKEGE